MRRLLLVFTLAACSRSSPPADELVAPPPIGRLDGDVDETATLLHVHYAGREVPLEDLPIAAHLKGLPMTGIGDIAIDLDVPKTAGHPDYRGTHGEIDVECPKGCTIGDDVARVQMPGFGGDGIDFGHVTLDRAHVRIAFADGHATITTWQVESKDIALRMRARIDLARDLDDSTIDGCLAFAPTDALLRSQPKTHAAISTTGASLGKDGQFRIALKGTLGKTQRLARDCTL